MNIGTFQNADNGRITGDMEALLVGRLRLTFVPNASGKGADYTILTETGCEVGAAYAPCRALARSRTQENLPAAACCRATAWRPAIFLRS